MPHIADKLEAMHLKLRQTKREWVLCENHRATLVEQKSRVEVYLEAMRLRLLHVVKKPEKVRWWLLVHFRVRAAAD